MPSRRQPGRTKQQTLLFRGRQLPAVLTNQIWPTLSPLPQQGR